MAKLRLQLDGKFEYLSGELSVVGFRDCERQFMKGEMLTNRRSTQVQT
jgi:hypothetical protein